MLLRPALQTSSLSPALRSSVTWARTSGTGSLPSKQRERTVLEVWADPCRTEKEVALLRKARRTGLHRGGDIELGLGGGCVGA